MRIYKMGYQLLDGRKAANEIAEEIKKNVKEKNLKIKLAVILVGNNPASETYLKNKRTRCKEAGIEFELTRFEEDTSEGEITAKIKDLNKDYTITGILVQLPLPKHLNEDYIINLICPEKDVDGLSKANLKSLANNDEKLVCCTPKGILRLLEKNGIDLNHKKIVLVGYGKLVGQPLYMILKNRNLNITICDINTKNNEYEIKQADILVSATGVPHLIRKDSIKDGAIVVDVGISNINGRMIGDVDFEEVKEKASWITPMPGGVGPMTIAMLLENLVKAYELQNKEAITL